MIVQEVYENLKANKSNLNDLLKSIQQRIGSTENWEEVTLDKLTTDYTLKTLYNEYKVKEKELDKCLNQEITPITLPQLNTH